MSLRTKIVGVTFENEDGTSRQDVISSLRVGDWVRMVDCASDAHPEAIGIFTQDWRQCGHLSMFEAERVRFAAPRDFKDFPVYVTAITGGNGDLLGCNIRIDGITYKTEPGENGKLVKRVHVDFPEAHVFDVPEADNDAPAYAMSSDAAKKSFSEKLGDAGQRMMDAGNKMQNTGKAIQKVGLQQTVGCITIFVCIAVIALVYFVISGIFR